MIWNRPPRGISSMYAFALITMRPRPVEYAFLMPFLAEDDTCRREIRSFYEFRKVIYSCFWVVDKMNDAIT